MDVKTLAWLTTDLVKIEHEVQLANIIEKRVYRWS